MAFVCILGAAERDALMSCASALNLFKRSNRTFCIRYLCHSEAPRTYSRTTKKEGLGNRSVSVGPS